MSAIDAGCHACLVIPTIDCWKRDSHDRPSFSEILKRLSTITPEFLSTPPETFQSIRLNWKEEVQGKFLEFKEKEQVCSRCNLVPCVLHLIGFQM